MKIVYADQYDQMSLIGSEILIDCLKQKPNALFCLATGASPTGLYTRFVEQIQKDAIDISQMKVLKLDEWVGIPKSSPSTCEHYLTEHILKPLHIHEDRYLSFDPLEQDEEKECNRIYKLIEEHGGIDCCILGIGKNGHLGLNEPGAFINPFIHKAVLDVKTKNHNMLSSHGITVEAGYTIGIKEILQSKQILLLVSGEGKKEVFEVLKRAEISSRYPANYLWLHNHTTCLVDLETVSQ